MANKENEKNIIYMENNLTLVLDNICRKILYRDNILVDDFKIESQGRGWYEVRFKYKMIKD